MTEQQYGEATALLDKLHKYEEDAKTLQTLYITEEKAMHFGIGAEPTFWQGDLSADTAREAILVMRKSVERRIVEIRKLFGAL